MWWLEAAWGIVIMIMTLINKCVMIRFAVPFYFNAWCKFSHTKKGNIKDREITVISRKNTKGSVSSLEW